MNLLNFGGMNLPFSVSYFPPSCVSHLDQMMSDSCDGRPPAQPPPQDNPILQINSIFVVLPHRYRTGTNSQYTIFIDFRHFRCIVRPLHLLTALSPPNPLPNK